MPLPLHDPDAVVIRKTAPRVLGDEDARSPELENRAAEESRPPILDLR